MACPRCGNPRCGTLGAEPPAPYVISEQCYAKPTLKYPNPQGFRWQFDEEMAQCDFCNESPDTMCQEDYAQCVASGVIPASLDRSELTQDQIAACRENCKRIATAEMLGLYCATYPPPEPVTPQPGPPVTPQPPAPGPPVTPVQYGDGAAKSSGVMPWLVGAAAAAAVFAGYAILKPSPKTRP